MPAYRAVKKNERTYRTARRGATSRRGGASKDAVAVSTKGPRVLALAADQLELPRGHVLFIAGDRAPDVYVVLSGSVKLALPRRASEADTVVALLHPGEMCEASATLLGQPHLVSATAVTKVKLARVAREHLLRAMSTDRLLAYEVTQELSRTVHALLGHVRGSAAAGTGAYRLVTFLLQQLPDGVARGPVAITLPVSKRAIAARLQLTPEHLSRVLRRLVTVGLLSVDGPDVVIRHVAQLRSYVGASSKRASRKAPERRVSRSRSLLAR
jgi:CRP-like cAMP-binding protein